MSHEEQDTLHHDLERVRESLAGADVPAFQDAAGLAVFIATSRELFEIVQLQHAVEDEVRVGPEAAYELLVDDIGLESWCVLLVDRRDARLLRGTAHGLREIASREDVLHQKHSAGGWSQARYQRSIEQDVQNHLKATAEDLFKEFQRDEFDYLAIGASSELMPEMESALHNYLSARLRGRFDIDVANTTVDAVYEAVKPVMAQVESEREQQVLEQLQQELGRGGRAVASRADVSRALTEKRVETLIVVDPHEAEDLIDLALAQAADVLVLKHEHLEDKDIPAAILRY